MSNPVDVKWFTSDMPGAPALSGQVGALIAVLDACLINGFGSITLTSLTVSSGVATAVKAGHGLLDHAVTLIAGATPSGLNGEKRITRVDANTFTFDATGISDQTATGTITAKVAPSGWTKQYSGTNKAVYQRTALAATAMVLRIDDTPTTYANIKAYESMSDVDTGIAAYPSSAIYQCKSNAASSAARPWTLFTDGQILYFFAATGANQWWDPLIFGDINSYKSPDAYHCLVYANAQSGYGYDIFYKIHDTAATRYIARSYAQTGGNVGCTLRTQGSNVSLPGLGGVGNPYQNEADNSFHAWPIELWEGITRSRGLMPGMWNPIHAATSLSQGLIIDSVPALAGHRLFVQMLSNSTYCCAIDMTGPWR